MIEKLYHTDRYWRSVNAMLGGAVIIMTTLSFVPSAKAVEPMTPTIPIGFSLSDLDPTKILRIITSANVNVHNHYPFAIRVVMDSNREAHVIASGGNATFTEANKGDRPTFRAHRDGAVIASKQVFLDGNKTLNFP